MLSCEHVAGLCKKGKNKAHFFAMQFCTRTLCHATGFGRLPERKLNLRDISSLSVGIMLLDLLSSLSNTRCPQQGSEMLGFDFCSGNSNCIGAKDLFGMPLKVGILWSLGSCTRFWAVL